MSSSFIAKLDDIFFDFKCKMLIMSDLYIQSCKKN